MPLVYPLLAYLLARMLWLGFRGGERLRPSAPTALARDRGGGPDRLPGDDQRRRLGRDRRRLRGHDRRRQAGRRRADLRRRPVSRRQQVRRHVRARQLLRLRPLRAGAAVERRVGRARGLTRGRDRVRPGNRDRALRLLLATAPRARRAPARRRRRVRLARLSIHGLRPAIERQRCPGRRPGGLVACLVRATCGSRRSARACGDGQVRALALGAADGCRRARAARPPAPGRRRRLAPALAAPGRRVQRRLCRGRRR